MLLRTLGLSLGLAVGSAQIALAQIDPAPRHLLQLAYNRPVAEAVSTDRYFDNDEFLRQQATTSLTSAPARLDGGLRFVQSRSPVTDLRTGVAAGVLDGHYDGAWSGAWTNRQSFDASWEGASLSLYPLINPSGRMPFTNVVWGHSLYDQSNSRGECVEPWLLAGLRRFEQSRGWEIGGGGLFSYGFRNQASRFVVHCEPSFNPPREAFERDFERERCIGLLFRFDLGKRKPVR